MGSHMHQLWAATLVCSLFDDDQIHLLSSVLVFPFVEMLLRHVCSFTMLPVCLVGTESSPATDPSVLTRISLMSQNYQQTQS